jgi:UDP-glucose 4-epimerase
MINKKRSILIFGCAGFIGTNLSKFFLKKGHNVIGVDNFYLGSRKHINQLKEEFSSSFKFYKLNIINKNHLLQIPKLNYKYIINLIANSDISKSKNNSFVDVNLNLITLINILDHFKNKSKKTKFFFASTSAIYGNNSMNVNEKTSEQNPISHYGSSKLACEKYINSFYEYHRLKHVIFRFPNVVGPHLTHGVIYDFLNKLKNNGFTSLKILGNGSQSKNYIYVDDLCEAIHMALKNKIKNIEIFNVSTKGRTNVKKIVQLIKKIFKKNFKTTYENKKIGWVGDVNKFSYKTDKIRNIGWKPKIDKSDEAIIKTIKWYKDKINDNMQSSIKS